MAHPARFSLDLAAQEVDVVLNALAARPWGEVNALMNSVLGQVQAQQQPAPAAAPSQAEASAAE